MSQAVTNVFVIHANGNEPANPASSEAVRIYDDIEYLAPLFSLSVTDIMKEVSLSMKSILGDYQDPADITNVVDDRELTITLPPSLLPSAVSRDSQSRPTKRGTPFRASVCPTVPLVRGHTSTKADSSSYN